MIIDYIENNYKFILKIIMFFIILLLGVFLKSNPIKIIFIGLIMTLYILKSYKENLCYEKIKFLEGKLSFYKEKDKKEEIMDKEIKEELELVNFNKEEEIKKDLVIVSHELRTPLTSILGFSKIIKKKLNNLLLEEIKKHHNEESMIIEKEIEKTIERVNIIIEEGEHLTRRIDSLFYLAKIEKLELTYKKEEVDIKEVINRAIVSCYELSIEKNIEVIDDIEEGIPKIIGDKDKLVELIYNLICNGIKFTENGKVVCRARMDGKQMIISVEDTGIGISKEDIPLLFNKFYQVENNKYMHKEGCGLGLAISKAIVEGHRGTIWIETKEDIGSKFIFTIPYN